MILRGFKKVFFYHYNIFFIKSQFSGFFLAIWRGARSMKNFAYGYTDREIGPGRPTPARPAPPLLYHKPQALSIGILQKKREIFNSLFKFDLQYKQFEIVYHRLRKRRAQ